MKKTALNNKVILMLNELDAIEDIHPSENWNQSLMDKLTVSKPASVSIFPSKKLAIIVLFIVLINVGYIIGTVINSSKHDIHRNNVLQVISKEFLINPTSINN